MISIDREALDLLEEYSTSLKNVALKLEKDKGFSALIYNAKQAFATSSYTILEYAFFEIVSVFNACADPVNNPLQKLGLVYLGLKFYSPNFLKSPANLKALLAEQEKEAIDHYLSYSQKVGEYQQAASPTGSRLLYATVLKTYNKQLFDEYAAYLYRFASLMVNFGNSSGAAGNLQKQVWELIYLDGIKNKKVAGEVKTNDKETLEDIIAELESLIGLGNVKKEVSTLVNFVKIQKEREKAKLNTAKVSYHCVFTGSPGTGKTTVARILSRIYKKLGVLNKGHLVETDRSGLVAEYAGQTAVKVDKVVQSALDGVLFIDEAYALIGETNDNYGQEAVAALLKRMEDNRERLVVIVAGYPNEMESFINDNPGLKSRFNRYIEFKDYTAKELFFIFKSFCTKAEYNVSKQAASKLRNTFQQLIDDKDETFGNGRLARNLFEKAIEKQANRLSLITTPLTKQLLLTIEPEDITS